MFNLKRHIKTLLFFAAFSSAHFQSTQDIQTMKSQYERMNRGQSQSIINAEMGVEDQGTVIQPKKATVSPYAINAIDSLDYVSKFFGYNFFTRRDSLAFWENLPTPLNYLLGPGDELIVSLWGETQLRKKYIISRDGKIYDNKVGVLNLMGKTIEEAQEHINSKFERVYSTLGGSKPTTYLDISLGQLRSINVNFVGEVKFPGVYPVHPFSNIITGLIQAGGVDTTGSLRTIFLKRGTEIKKIDLYNYLIKGDIPKGIQLRDQDVIVIPPRLTTVTIDSAVVRPGIYESLPDETIFDLINYAGGLQPYSSKTVGIRRIVSPDSSDKINSYIKNFYVDYQETKERIVKNGDIITILSIFESDYEVEIIGQVKKPGVYYFFEGMTLLDLIDLGGGFKDTSYFESVYKVKGELIRMNSKEIYDEIISIDLNGFDQKNDFKNIKLKNFDRFVVHSNIHANKRKNINISGEINIPGYYVLKEDNETLQSLINRSGGITDNALESGVSIFRDKNYFENPPEDKKLEGLLLEKEKSEPSIIKQGFEEVTKNKIKLAWQDLDIILMPGDSIVVRPKVGAVYVAGEVYNPGLVGYQKNKSVRFYLNSAGGINNYGNRNNVVIVYPNGITVPWRRWKFNRIIDGSTIVVYQKADMTPFDITAFTSNLSSVLTSVVTIILLSEQLKN